MCQYNKTNCIDILPYRKQVTHVGCMLLLNPTLLAIKETVYLIRSNMAAVLMSLVVVCKYVEICKSFACPFLHSVSLKYGLHTMHNIKATERRIKLPCTVIQSFFEITVSGDF